MINYGRRAEDRRGVASEYHRSRVMSSTPTELIVMLYEQLLADLKGGAMAIRSGDLEAKAVRLARANDVIFELLGSLDRERGGEVSERLAALYAYMISRVGEASRRLDASALDEVAEHVESLLSAWRTVSQEQKQQARGEGLDTSAQVHPR